MIHKVENAVDLDSGAILSVEMQAATKGDATDMAAHFETAASMVEYTASIVDGEVDGRSETDLNGPEEASDENDDGTAGKMPSAASKRHAVGDKGYHKNEELAKLVEAGFEPVIAEPAGRQIPKRSRKQAEAFEANRENRKSEEGRELLRRRGEKVERSSRHLLDHGAAHYAQWTRQDCQTHAHPRIRVQSLDL
jgi:transposase